MDKKHAQLGMNPSTAQNRLVKDILYDLIKDTPCFHCGEKLTRDTFSIEHKVAWLDSENPVRLFFDLSNISYSHHSCNVGASRQTSKFSSKEEWLVHKAAKNRAWRGSLSVEQNKERRRQQYLRTGK